MSYKSITHIFPRFNSAGADEFSALADSFDDMADNITVQIPAAAKVN